MCGICGWLDARDSIAAEPSRERIERMARALNHRGPDDRGHWVDADSRVALGHRRLSIVDLSPTGHQPMISRSGRWIIVFNGEIYNHADLRARLESRRVAFRGRSDTEVLVEAIDHWGIATSVERLVGMFAFAVWDRAERALTLVRDRLGVKPLFHARFGSAFLFGSEIKAIRAHPAFAARVDRGAEGLFLAHGYIPSPHTAYDSVHKLPPGTMLRVTADDRLRVGEPDAYWTMRDVVERGRESPFTGPIERAEEELHDRIRDSVRLHMVSDVPVGAFLSGGVDSSTVVAMMRQVATGPVRTFTIGFQESAVNEGEHARKVADHLGTEHVEFTVRPEDALDLIPSLVDQYDEPFGDSSAIPTCLVSRLTREHVKVCLSGDGGDELFAGYDRYARIESTYRQFRSWPAWMRSAIEAVVPRLPGRFMSARWYRRALTLCDLLRAGSPQEMYVLLHTHWRRPQRVMKDGRLPATIFHQPSQWPETENAIESMMFIDAITYLPDDVLTKVDRASMAVGLEARVPLLDHRLVEFAWRLPFAWKRQGEETKIALRRVLARYVPRPMFERGKAGFGIPLSQWLRGPLRDWAESLLDPRALESEGLLDAAAVRRKWREHCDGTSDWSHLIWDLLMWKAWRLGAEQGAVPS
ncbi:MAG: asparagine synthase (glutamine-hydrolyzing) [Planctomycetes bacterium]|nr:asparagine synthase (glutamine-hydrolyzing) [Planctomycetota bacterium]